MSEWFPIKMTPKDGTAVIYYFSDLTYVDQDGKPADWSAARDHVERAGLGYYEDGQWWEANTGHEVFEDWKPMKYLPTHWMPLPNPPEAKP